MPLRFENPSVKLTFSNWPMTICVVNYNAFMMPRGFEISSIKPSFRYIKFDVNEVVYYGSKWEFGGTNNILRK